MTFPQGSQLVKWSRASLISHKQVYHGQTAFATVPGHYIDSESSQIAITSRAFIVLEGNPGASRFGRKVDTEFTVLVGTCHSLFTFLQQTCLDLKERGRYNKSIKFEVISAPVHGGAGEKESR